jgi:hypothetical protein
MKRIVKTSLLALVASAVFLSPASVLAQGQGGGGGQGGQGRGQRGGNFDPAQMQQRMMDNMREQFGVKDDAEWKIISERVQKVMEARRDSAFGGGMRMGMRPGGPGGDAAGGPGGQGRRGFGASSPEGEALAKAIESKASKDELKSAMGKYRDARKANQAKLEQAQEELKKVLSVEQEAVALQLGMVN